MKNIIILFLLALFVQPALCQSGEASYLSGMNAVSGGISVGAVIAIVASWSRNKSVLWAIVHGFLGWIYVIYYVITRSSRN